MMESLPDGWKILQIIPPPCDLYLRHSYGDGKQYASRIICLALIEDPNGDRVVRYLDTTNGCGDLDVADLFGNIIDEKLDAINADLRELDWRAK